VFKKVLHKNPDKTEGIKVCQKWSCKSVPNHGGSDLITTTSLNIPSPVPYTRGIKPSLIYQ
jgi:hypothetical protein